jgi:hypothetical protein
MHVATYHYQPDEFSRVTAYLSRFSGPAQPNIISAQAHRLK